MPTLHAAPSDRAARPLTLYTDNDPALCEWVENLVERGHLPPGKVECQDIAAADFAGFSTVHAFCGVGGWPLAAMLAGWPAAIPLWTGSCPCQPFSTAGYKGGKDDDRHVWPAFRARIAEQEPAVVVGEQVAGRLGLDWFAGVRDDLEAAGYAVGASCLPACSVSAPHKRERLFWIAVRVGYAPGDGCGAGNRNIGGRGEPGAPGASTASARRLGHSDGLRLETGRVFEPSGRLDAVDPGGAAVEGLGHSDGLRFYPWVVSGEGGGEGAESSGESCAVVECADGVSRRIPTEPGLHPLAYGIPNRVVRIRAYGNAIVPQVGARFLRAVMACLGLFEGGG